MIESQREILMKRASEYLSIGITEGGQPRSVVPVPWEATVHAFNMRTPTVYLAPEDLTDAQIMDLVRSYRVIGCYIWAPLEDYSFLSLLKDLQDLNIMEGEKVQDLCFLEELENCGMFCLQNATLKNIDPILRAKTQPGVPSLRLRCVGLDNCRIEDVSAFENADVQFSEFLVWNPEDRDERARWAMIKARTKKCYTFRQRG